MQYFKETTLHKTGIRKKKDNYKESEKCKDGEYDKNAYKMLGADIGNEI